MPKKLKRPCTYPGCPELTDGGRCEKHKKQEARRYDEQRGTAASRGYGSRWQEARLVYLRRHPLCVVCEKEGKITAGTVVDHIIPHRGNRELFWDVNNWQTLCTSHHSEKTAREDGRWG
ncbi:MAG: HNH endonuclease signature motif containing protein [Eubacteriales bacterium]